MRNILLCPVHRLSSGKYEWKYCEKTQLQNHIIIVHPKAIHQAIVNQELIQSRVITKTKVVTQNREVVRVQSQAQAIQSRKVAQVQVIQSRGVVQAILNQATALVQGQVQVIQDQAVAPVEALVVLVAIAEVRVAHPDQVAQVAHVHLQVDTEDDGRD